jgi:large subunit ribosomal protein L20
MSRARGIVAAHRKKKSLFKRAKGFVGDRKNHIRLTKDAVMKALAYQYIHRKRKKRDFRSLWTLRINVGSRINGLSYSRLIQGLKKAGCTLNRKVLADMAYGDPKAFSEVAKTAKESLS